MVSQPREDLIFICDGISQLQYAIWNAQSGCELPGRSGCWQRRWDGRDFLSVQENLVAYSLTVVLRNSRQRRPECINRLSSAKRRHIARSDITDVCCVLAMNLNDENI